MALQPSGVWLVHSDTDRWKSFEHARWMTTEGKPGACYIYGELLDAERGDTKRLPKAGREHFNFAKHVTAEQETDELIRGILRRVWKVKAGQSRNEYLDASYLADEAAGMLNVRIIPTPTVPEAPKKSAVLVEGRTNQPRW
jgi:hypothetical protein